MDIKDLILTDEAMSIIDNGTWVGDMDEAPGVQLLVCGLRSEAARKALREKQAKMRVQNRGRPLSDDQLARSTKETLAEVVLKDWKGLKSDGEEVPYSRELAEKWLLSRKGEQFVSLVLLAANRVDAQANYFVEGVEKN